MRWLRIEGRFGNVKYYCNPVIITAVFIIVFAAIVWAFVDDDSQERLVDAKKWITDIWTWLYVAEQFIWLVFVLFIYFRWGHLKLGREEDVPAHGELSYFVMIFCTGLSAAKYYSGVNDPIEHYDYAWKNSSIIYWGKSGLNEQAQNAINITLYHWGIFGYAAYTLPAIAISFLAYRKGLPVTMRTCLYPIIGHKIYGRVGDFIDITSVSVIIFGVSVGLAIGADLLITGIHEWSPKVDLTSDNRIITIWCLIVVSTVSVVSGIGSGIKHLSYITFFVGVAVLLVTLLVDNTWYLLNVFVQSVGYQMQYIVGTGLHTDAFTQAGDIPNQNPKSQDWFHENTLFYWGWWIAIAPLSATFTARISRGRRIRELIMYSFFLPTLCLYLWFTTFGGVAIKMQQKAIAEDITCEHLYHNQHRNESHERWKELNQKYNNIDNLACLTPSAKFFAIMEQYDDISKALYALTMLAIVLQFVTFADSASLVIDIIASNGKKNPPIGQRAFWALVQGAAATAFIKYAGNNEGFDSIKAVAVIASLPLIIIINMCCVGLWRVLSNEKGFQLDTEFKEWKMYYGNINSKRHLMNAFIATICPWWFLGKIVIKRKNYRSKRMKLLAYISFAIPFYLWVALVIAQVKIKNVDKFGWVSLLLFFGYASYYRQLLREKQQLAGNIGEDFIVMILYPFSVLQMFNESESIEYGEDTPNNIELPTILYETECYEPGVSPNDSPYSTKMGKNSQYGDERSLPTLSDDMHQGFDNYSYIPSERDGKLNSESDVVNI